MSSHTRIKTLSKIPLRTLLIVPFVVQIVLVGVMGYLSFQNGRHAVNDVAHQLRREISARIEEHLSIFLGIPYRINRINASAIRQGFLGANDPEALERYFWEQIHDFDSVTSIYFGNTEGGIVDVGREGTEGSLYVIASDAFASGPFRKFATDNQGNRTDLLVTIPDFDARTRPWYTSAVAKGDATWSDIYILFTGQDMAVSASRPVYDKGQNLLGVVSVDIFVSQISNFLKSLEIGKTGQCFIIERSGLLVASSSDENPFTDLNGEEAQKRVYAKESTIPLIRDAAGFLTKKFGDLNNITGEQDFTFKMNGQRHFLQVVPVWDAYGIDWLTIVVIPESDFLAQIKANNLTIALLMSVIMIGGIVVGIITIEWVTKPILRLNDSVQALAKGQWKPIDRVKRIDEIGELASSFDAMAGQLSQTLEKLTHEISERELVETSLAEERNLLRTVIDNIPDYIYAKDTESRFIISNITSAQAAGMGTPEELLGKSDFEIFPQELAEQYYADDQDIIRSGEPQINQVEPLLDHRIDKLVWVAATKIPLRDRRGEIVGLVGISRDITKQKEAEELQKVYAEDLEKKVEVRTTELREVQEQMLRREKLAALGQLAGSVSHELRNPLGVVKNAVYLLNMVLENPGAEIRKVLETLNEEVETMEKIVSDLLEFARTRSSTRHILNVNAVLKETLSRIQLLDPSFIEVVLQLGENLSDILADPTQLGQVFGNLIQNGFQAMPSGGCLVIRTFMESPEWVGISITDTGVGISEANMAKLFEPLFTTKARGIGLGMVVVKTLVVEHGGMIEVESSEGQGSTFTVKLPVSEVGK
ncbi:MAG: ATP-binding protein [Anaerolineae bacterium]|nr:ATP-binding protein [Anaerolineae bacterium]